MDFSSLDSLVTAQIIIFSVLIVLLVPLLLHFFAYRSKTAVLPTFLITGPQNAGKTSLLTLLQNGTVADTQTSSTHLTVEISLPSASEQTNDSPQVIILTDTPGHPKLRSNALDRINETTMPLSGVIFLIDSASLSTPVHLFDTVNYLYNLLVTLQARSIAVSGSVFAAKSTWVPVLVACNKSDLFTALPASKISKLFETELENLRESKAKGLMDVAAGEGGEDAELLGEDGGGAFSWQMMEEVGIEVTVKGGSVKDRKTNDWLEWLNRSLIN